MNNKYSFRKQVFTCEEILNMIELGTLRFGGYTYGTNSRWTKGMSRLFISQQLSGMLLSDIILDSSEKIWYVIGGERQLKCINDFVQGKLELDVWEDSDNISTFERLPLALKRKLLNTEIVTSVLNAGATARNRYHVYEMVGTIEGFSDLWAIARIIFPKGYANVERIANEISSTYPSAKPYHRQLVRLPLLWEISNDLANLLFKDSISNETKIDAVLIPLLENYSPDDYKRNELMEDCSFLRFHNSKEVFLKKGGANRLVLILLLLQKILNPASEEEMIVTLKKYEKLWAEMPVSIRGDSYQKLENQIDYIANKINR